MPKLAAFCWIMPLKFQITLPKTQNKVKSERRVTLNSLWELVTAPCKRLAQVYLPLTSSSMQAFALSEQLLYTRFWPQNLFYLDRWLRRSLYAL